MNGTKGRGVGVGAAAGLALALAACGSGGGGGGELEPSTATPELVSLTSEGGSVRMGPPGWITVSAAASYADGSFVRVGTFDQGAIFGLGTNRERAFAQTLPAPGIYVARYHPDGTAAWVCVAMVDGPPPPPSDVVAMPDGSVIFTGRRGNSMLFDSTAGGLYALDRGTNGSYTACYGPSGALLWLTESVTGAWDAKLAVAGGGAEFAMLVPAFFQQAVIAPNSPAPVTFGPSDGSSIVARFRAATGALLGTTPLDAGPGSLPPSICSTTDGGFAVAGTYTDSTFFSLRAPEGGRDAYVLRFDATSNLAWKAHIASSTLETIDAVAGTPGGGLVATGLYVDSCTITGATRSVTLPRPPPIAVHVQRADPVAASRWLCAWDAAGEVLWARVLADTTTDSFTVRLAAGADGSILLADTHRDPETIDPDGAAYAVPAADPAVRDTLLLRLSSTGVLRNVGRLVGDPTAEVAGLCPQPAGAWLVFMTGADDATYDPAGPEEATAPLRGDQSAFTLRLRTP